MPRKFINEKKIIKEIIVSKFDDSFNIEAYIANSDGFGGQGDILSKFGVRSTDEVTFIISKERYETFITPFIKNKADIKLKTRPQEGDLIYLPLDNSLFEIKYVEGKRPFYQLNNLYVYELRCELFEYEDEIIDTGLSEVDSTIKDFGYTTTLKMVTLEAETGVLSLSTDLNTLRALYPNQKSVSYIDIINGGYGYKSTPEVKIERAPQGGMNATAVAIITTRGSESTVEKVLIVNPGIGYTVPPKVSINSSSGSGFIATSIINYDVLPQITIVNSGSEYSTPPTISISTSPTGDNADAIATINSLGEISSVSYSNVGSGYTENPQITVESSSGISTGSYIYNEIIRGVSTGTSAYVKDWDINERVLKVGIIDGNFALGEYIEGSSATYKIYSIETDDLYDKFASNNEIEEEADQILDFSESNPFGEF